MRHRMNALLFRRLFGREASKGHRCLSFIAKDWQFSSTSFTPNTLSETNRGYMRRRHPTHVGRKQLSTGNSNENSRTTKILEDVIITNACIKRIKALQNRAGNNKLKLRLSVEGGGCSGFQYTFTMDESDINEDDRIFERDGAKVVIDEGAMEFVKGATVDFVEDMMKSAFAVINNPQSESACGCGSSFALKNFQNNPAID